MNKLSRDQLISLTKKFQNTLSEEMKPEKIQTVYNDGVEFLKLLEDVACDVQDLMRNFDSANPRRSDDLVRKIDRQMQHIHVGILELKTSEDFENDLIDMMLDYRRCIEQIDVHEVIIERIEVRVDSILQRRHDLNRLRNRLDLDS